MMAMMMMFARADNVIPAYAGIIVIFVADDSELRCE